MSLKDVRNGGTGRAGLRKPENRPDREGRRGVVTAGQAAPHDSDGPVARFGKKEHKMGNGLVQSQRLAALDMSDPGLALGWVQDAWLQPWQKSPMTERFRSPGPSLRLRASRWPPQDRPNVGASRYRRRRRRSRWAARDRLRPSLFSLQAQAWMTLIDPSPPAQSEKAPIH